MPSDVVHLTATIEKPSYSHNTILHLSQTSFFWLSQVHLQALSKQCVEEEEWSVVKWADGYALMCFASSLFDARTGERETREREAGKKGKKKTPSCRCLLNRAKVDRRYTISWKVCNLMIIHLADKDGSAVTYQLYSSRDGGFSAGGVEKWLKKFPCWVFSFHFCTNEVRKTRERSIFTFYTNNM